MTKIAIIGSGPGGMIAAHTLCENNISVTMYERGGYFPQKGEVSPFSVDEMDRKYADKGLTVALGNPNVSYVEGQCLGGGSEVNAGLYHRTPSSVLASWRADFGLKELDESTLHEHFVACENLVNVCKMPFKPPLASRKMEEGAAHLGWKCIEVPRWYKYESAEDRGVFSGTRQSMTEAVVPKLASAFFSLKKHAFVKTIREVSGGRVRLFYRNQDNEFEESEVYDAVFVCAGAINTPWLLKKSKLGSKYVGKNLRLHSTVKMTARFLDEVNSETAGIPVHQVKEFAPNFSIGGSTSNLPFLVSGLTDNGLNPLAIINDWKHFSTYYAMIAEGYGCIRLIPGVNRPIVQFSIPDSGMDLLAQALRKLGELLFAANATELYPSIRGYPVIRSVGELSSLPNRLCRNKTSLMTIHLMGSCHMGSTHQSCVDNEGRLRGHNNIYVMDASILPTALGANPQGTVMALSRYLTSKFIKRSLA